MITLKELYEYEKWLMDSPKRAMVELLNENISAIRNAEMP